MAALTRGGADPVIYAPETDQAHVVDHQSGQEMPQTRGVMNESARIARGPVRPLSQLTSADAEAIIVPGGFGAAKNLCDFGFKGKKLGGFSTSRTVFFFLFSKRKNKFYLRLD